MSTTQRAQLVAELRIAEAEDSAARKEALVKGLIATQPLTVIRLGELCALGEKMQHTGIRRKQALARLQLLAA
jgi:hypothetical protein